MRSSALAILAVVASTASCSFQVAAGTSVDGGASAIDTSSSIDTATAIDAALVAIDARVPGSCASAGCEAACQLTGGTPVCYAPATCADAQAHGQGANAMTTLYVGSDATKPWTAYCAGSNEYLVVDAGSNYSQYTAGGASSGTSLRTSYAKLRIDPVALTIDIDDQTYATSSGGPLTHGSSGISVTSMPYGVAMDCDNNYSSTGVAKIDLTRTPFVVTNTFADHGNKSAGSAADANGGRQVAISGGGYCGWDAPSAYAVNGPQGNPFNPTTTPAPNVTLAYTP